MRIKNFVNDKMEPEDHIQEEKFIERKPDSKYTSLELIGIISTVSLTAMMAMADQTAMPIISPFISDDLDAHTSIQWAGTGALIASTIFNIMIGRFTAIFDSKIMMVSSLFIIGIFVLLSAFVQDKILFYIFRSLSGFGNGGTISLAIYIVSYSVDPLKVGIYQGILGLFIGIGSCIGPFISSAFVTSTNHSGWRRHFFFMGCLFILTAFVSIITISAKKESKEEDKRDFDYLGLLFSSATVILALVPLNMGGIVWEWNSLGIILTMIFAFLSFVALIITEAMSTSPLIPLEFFRIPDVLMLFIQTLIISLIYSSMIYYLPYQLIMVQEYSLAQVPIILLALLIPLSLGSIISGFIISAYNRFRIVIVLGYIFLLIGSILASTILSKETPLTATIMILICMGTGAGFIFTPITTAIQTKVELDKVSLVLSTKAVFKTLGNSIGVAISSLIYSSSLIKELDKHELSTKDKQYIIGNKNRKVNLSYIFQGDKLSALETIYSISLKTIFVIWIPLIAICLILAFIVEKEQDPENNEKS